MGTATDYSSAVGSRKEPTVEAAGPNHVSRVWSLQAWRKTVYAPPAPQGNDVPRWVHSAAKENNGKTHHLGTVNTEAVKRYEERIDHVKAGKVSSSRRNKRRMKRLGNCSESRESCGSALASSSRDVWRRDGVTA